MLKNGGSKLSVSKEGNLEVEIQDQTSDRLSLFLAQVLGLVTSISGAAKDESTFNIITDGVVPVIGNFICMQEEQKITQEEIISVALVSGNEYTITLAVPLDYDYTTSGSCSIQNVDMDVDGSITEVDFLVGPKIGEWDITRMMVSMVLSSAGDDGLFGNLTALTNGQYFRKEDSGDAQNLFIVKENSDFAIEGYDVSYPIRSGGGGSNGMRSRITFNGPDKSGVVVRLSATNSDTFKSVIRDDLTGLVRYRVKVQGHVVQN